MLLAPRTNTSGQLRRNLFMTGYRMPVTVASAAVAAAAQDYPSLADAEQRELRWHFLLAFADGYWQRDRPIPRIDVLGIAEARGFAAGSGYRRSAKAANHE